MRRVNTHTVASGGPGWGAAYSAPSRSLGATRWRRPPPSPDSPAVQMCPEGLTGNRHGSGFLPLGNSKTAFRLFSVERSSVAPLPHHSRRLAGAGWRLSHALTGLRACPRWRRGRPPPVQLPGRFPPTPVPVVQCSSQSSKGIAVDRW